MHGNIELLWELRKESDTGISALRLTPRGKEVFTLIMRGLTIAQIAVRLGISYSGVLRHREKMLLQNNCRSMPELITKYNGEPAETDITDNPVYLYSQNPHSLQEHETLNLSISLHPNTYRSK